MDQERVSIATLAKHYGYYRWVIERPSAGRFVDLWGRIGASGIHDHDKETLTNVIWALASLERAYQVLQADAARAEEVMNVGAPAAMTFLSGPYGPDSLHYLLGTSLWMDLGDVIVGYRTLDDRLNKLRQAVRRSRVAITHGDFENEIAVLRARRLPELGNQPIRDLAKNLLHHHWHPTSPGISFGLYWTGNEGERTVNFTQEGDLRDSLFTVVDQTIDQITALVRRLTAVPPQQPSP